MKKLIGTLFLSILLLHSTAQNKPNMQTVKPFKIEVPQSVLDDLKARIKQTRWADAPENAGWNYGTNPAYLKELADYWANQYDWRKHEAKLNEFPQFIAEVDGIKIHFLHIKGKGADPKPLILSHGWPDCFYRYYKVIPILAEQGFDVIVPSIPGFGFSDHVSKSVDGSAEIFYKLMTDVLGYKTFIAAGGDMGTGITKGLANKYPEAVKAIFLSDVGYPDGTEDWSKMSPALQEFGQFIQQWWYTEGAYNMMHSTKPQTLANGLNDSPVGLASWILEKFYTWRFDPAKHDIEKSFSKDELLTNITIYWVTQTINSSMRTYLETARATYTGGLESAKYVKTPTGVAHFPGDGPLPKEWAERMVNVKRYTVFPDGGHFAALEKPDLWARELITFFSDIEVK
jgi:pimeloyl-ACP methyl ester carboxylesterase